MTPNRKDRKDTKETNDRKDTKETVKKAVADVAKAFVVGVIAAAVLAVVLFAGGFLFGHFQVTNGFEVMKDGLLLIGAIGLFLVAGMLLAKGKKENADEKKEAKNGWRNQFAVIGLKTVVLVISVAFLLMASVADWILLHM
jgi:high-affinity Fe2+/Pb2+ permease